MRARPWLFEPSAREKGLPVPEKGVRPVLSDIVKR